MKTLSIAVFVIAFSQAALSDDAPDAKAAMAEYFAATQIYDVAAMSNLIHPEALSEFRAVFDNAFAGSNSDLAEKKSARFEIIGESVQGGVTHLTYRLELDVNGRTVNQDIVQRLKKHQEKWLLLLPASSEASIANIKARYSQ